MPLKKEEVEKLAKSPGGRIRPQDGRGKGKGMEGGQKENINPEECPEDGPGKGKGGGRGKGKFRK